MTFNQVVRGSNPRTLTWEPDTYELVPVTDKIKADEATQKKIDELSDTVDTNYLSNFSYTREEILQKMILNSTASVRWKQSMRS